MHILTDVLQFTLNAATHPPVLLVPCAWKIIDVLTCLQLCLCLPIPVPCVIFFIVIFSGLLLYVVYWSHKKMRSRNLVSRCWQKLWPGQTRVTSWSLWGILTFWSEHSQFFDRPPTKSGVTWLQFLISGISDQTRHELSNKSSKLSLACL